MPETDPLLQPTPPAPKDAPPSGSPVPAKICLLILFNHRFEANLPKLDWIYRGKFEHIRYLIPFYRGDRPDVIPVYYSSFQFHGYFMEVWTRLRGEGFTHFVVCADDMVLNPVLTDKNFFDRLGIGPDDGFIQDMMPLNQRDLEWFAFGMSLVATAGKNGVNWEQELPPADIAAANLAAKGYSIGRIGLRNLRRGIRAKGFFQTMFYFVLRWVRRRGKPGTDLRALPYPFMSANSDLFTIPAAYMEKFAFYSSVLAAMGVFVEVALPTALALACPRVVIERDTGWKLQNNCLGTEDPAKIDDVCRQYGYRLENLLAGFGERIVCMHPIKLSQWSYPEAAA